MEKGDKLKIAKYTKLSQATVSRYFTGYRPINNKTRWKINRAIKQLNIDYNPKIGINATSQHKDRYDIYNNLPHGALKILAKEVGCSTSNVKYVLEGKYKDNYGIIKKAELMAAIYIWKVRFCKYESQL